MEAERLDKGKLMSLDDFPETFLFGSLVSHPVRTECRLPWFLNVLLWMLSSHEMRVEVHDICVKYNYMIPAPWVDPLVVVVLASEAEPIDLLKEVIKEYCII